MILLTIIVSILILGLLIFVHEFGHFISAKKAGMEVEEFGFGFPPRLFGIKKGGTLYSVNLIPLGGFVKIYGEQRTEKEKNKKRGRLKKDKRAFYAKPIWKRAIVLAMGVIMNLFLAAILLSIVHGLGVPTVVEKGMEKNASNVQLQILSIAPDSPAANAGLKMGDSIKQLIVYSPYSHILPQITVTEVEEVQEFVARHAGEEITLVVKRGEEVLEKVLTPRMSPPDGEGPMGIALARVGLVRYPWYSAIWQGFKTTGQMTVGFIGLFYQLFKNLILTGRLIGEIAGPVGIASLTHQMTKLGLVYVLQFTAIFSINLAILNAIPFPALDGGRLLFLAIEKIKGSPIKIKTEQLVNGLGFAILIFLMLLVTFRDIAKLF